MAGLSRAVLPLALVLALSSLAASPAPAETRRAQGGLLATDGVGFVPAAGVATLTSAATVLPTRRLRLWIVPVYWGTAPTTSVREAMLARAKEASAFLRDESLGRVLITPYLRPNLQVARYSGCAADQAQAKAAKSLGPTRRTAIDIVVTATPAKADCPQYGFAWSPGNSLWVSEWKNPAALAHELGHALFGLGHAGSVTCESLAGDPLTLGGRCRGDEYGNPYDVMGGAFNHGVSQGRPVFGGFAASSLVAARLRPATNARLLPVSATVRLLPRAAASGPTAYAVPWYANGSDNDRLWIEYRTATGSDFWIADPADALAPGAGVLVSSTAGPYGGWSASGLVNMGAGAGETSYRPALRPGQSWTTPNGAVRLELLEQTPGYATVRVTRLTSDTSAPRLRIARPERARVGRKWNVTVWWSASDNVAVARTVVRIDRRKSRTFRDESPVFVGRASDGSLNVKLANGRHRVRVTTVDYAGHAVTKTRVFRLKR